jgi:hypothetical protein
MYNYSWGDIVLCPPHVNCTFPTFYQPPVYLPPNPLEYQIFWQNLNNTTTLLPSIQLYTLYYSIIHLIMASQESNTTCETLSEAEILTESESEDTRPTTSHDTTRDQCIAIKTALLFKVPWKKIRQELYVTNRQIQYTNRYRTTPQKKKKCGRKPKLSTPKRQALEAWLLESPSRRYIP